MLVCIGNVRYDETDRAPRVHGRQMPAEADIHVETSHAHRTQLASTRHGRSTAYQMTGKVKCISKIAVTDDITYATYSR